MVDLKQLSTGSYVPDWCPGCGNFGILNSIKRAIVKLNLKPEEVVIVSGIGCSSKLPQWINTFGFHGVHGRGLPVGMGIKIANKKLHVIVIGGDGDVYGEGMNHFIQAMRKNVNLTLIVHDNQIYGLTKGQTSPTTMKGDSSPTQPYGKYDEAVNPIALAVAQKASYVARGFAGDLNHLSDLIADAINYNGFAYIDVMQPCITFNKHNTFDWFRKRVYKLEEKGHDPTSHTKALKKAFEFGEKKVPIGVIYKEEHAEPFEDHYPVVKDKPLVKLKVDNISIKDLMDELC